MAHIGKPHTAVPYVTASQLLTGEMLEDPPGSGLFVLNVTETTEDDDD